jgi:hypothetical protein
MLSASYACIFSALSAVKKSAYTLFSVARTIDNEQ